MCVIVFSIFCNPGLKSISVDKGEKKLLEINKPIFFLIFSVMKRKTISSFFSSVLFCSLSIIPVYFFLPENELYLI